VLIINEFLNGFAITLCIMKIRIKDNSVRYRLTKSEVKKLCTEHYLSATTEFATTYLQYAIAVKENITLLDADYIDHKITLFFPAVEAAIWYDSDRITYENTIVLPNGNLLKLLLEKDFVCLDHSTEDQSDNYQNPNKTC
jgi:hypothetical protein